MKRIVAATAMGACLALIGSVDTAFAGCYADGENHGASPSGFVVSSFGQSVWVNVVGTSGEAGAITAVGAGETGGSLSGLSGSAYGNTDNRAGTYSEGEISGSANSGSEYLHAGGDGAGGLGASSGEFHATNGGPWYADDVDANGICLTP
jgi:hypothetical protein